VQGKCQAAVPHLKKLYDRSVPMVYLGVEGRKAHWLYDSHSKKIVVNKDVVFEESKVWKWNSGFAEGSEFIMEEDVDSISQQWRTSAANVAN
jgi:hypothetical protein